MANKAVFLDRDGTINVDKHYLYRAEEFEFIEGAVEGLKLLQDNGYKLIIITNQSGIARGYYTEEDYLNLEKWMENELKTYGVSILKSYYCPHLENAVVSEYKKECSCRKPQMGMFLKATEEFGLDLASCYAIGDRLRDCCICFHSECKGFLIGDTEKAEVKRLIKSGWWPQITYKNNLLEAAKSIVTIATSSEE